jgi:LysM repeat protein
MGKLSLPNWFWVICLLAFGLAGCELTRTDDSSGDIAQPVPSVVIPETAVVPQGEAEFAPPEAAQAANAIIRPQPPEQQINVGDTATVEIRLADVTNLVGADVELRFDPAILQVQDADPNANGVQIQPGDFLAANFVVTNNADNSTGIIRYALTQLAPTPPVSGEGLLFRVTFQGVAQGVSDLIFSTVQLANSDFQEIPTTSETGRVIVGQVTITLTPSPTVVGASPTPVTPTPTVPPGVTVTPGPTVETPTPTASPIPTTTVVIPTPPPPPPPTPIPPLANLPFDLPPGGTLGFCYRVQPGENIYSLAQKFGYPPQVINVVNDLHPPGHTYVHQVLFIPTQLGHGPNFYEIQTGDTLTSIADQCRLTAAVLAKANGIDENDLIGAGQILRIPIPPFPPPSRYPYPLPIVPVPGPPGCCPPPHR